MVTMHLYSSIISCDRELRQLFAHVLTKNGYTVLGVSNGEEALAALEQSYYDLIISDITPDRREYPET